MEIARVVGDLHPRNDTFPGEVFIELAARALELAAASSRDPIAYEGLLAKYLPECEFRGRQNRKIQFAVLVSAATRGGLEPDLLDEVSWWQTDDFWRYALYAAVAIIRACAEHRDISIEEFARQLLVQVQTPSE